MTIHLALYQPDIPQNVGAAIRLCACLGVPLDIILPCGFPWDDKKIKISAMDYFDLLDLHKHQSWERFNQQRQEDGKNQKKRRIILLTTKTDIAYHQFDFQENDTLLLGRESAGVPLDIHQSADAQITIPMIPGARSMNVINAGALILGEALRQTRWKTE